MTQSETQRGREVPGLDGRAPENPGRGGFQVVTEGANTLQDWLELHRQIAVEGFQALENTLSLRLGTFERNDSVLRSIQAGVCIKPSRRGYDLSSELRIPTAIEHTPQADEALQATLLDNSGFTDNYTLTRNQRTDAFTITKKAKGKDVVDVSDNTPKSKFTLTFVDTDDRHGYIINLSENELSKNSITRFPDHYEQLGELTTYVANAMYDPDMRDVPTGTIRIAPDENLPDKVQNGFSLLDDQIRNRSRREAAATVYDPQEHTNKYIDTRILLHEKPDVFWDEIGGNEQAKRTMEIVSLGINKPDSFKELGIEPPKGVLLHGPSNVGKTELIKAFINETNAIAFVVNLSDVSSAAFLQAIFDRVAKHDKALMVFENLDAIAPNSPTIADETRNIITVLEQNLGGVRKRKFTVVGTTTNIEAVAPSLIIPGRFGDRIEELVLPDSKAREEIFGIKMNLVKTHSQVPLFVDGYDYAIKTFAVLTEGLTGADISTIIQWVVSKRVLERAGKNPITNEELIDEIRKYRPGRDSTNDNLTGQYL